MRNSIAVIALLLIAISSISYAGGPVHGGKAAGMGTAFIAVADDPSAILFNPAGLTLSKGTNIYGGNTILIPKTKYESPAGDNEETEFRVYFPPHIYISSDFGMEKVVFGIGVHPTFGIGGREWPEDGLTRFRSVKGFTATLTINPTIAWQVSPVLSIAFGVDYMRALTESRVMLDQSAFGAGDAEMRIETEGGGWGYNLGALVNISEKLKVGLTFRSRIKIDDKGDLVIEDIAPALQPLYGSSEFNTDVRSSSTFPEIYSFGIAYFPNENLVIDFDVEFLTWSFFKRAGLDLDDEVPAAGLTDVTTQLDWKDSWQFKIGLDYRVHKDLSLRAGYAFINTPVPEHTLSPANPDADQHNFSVGAGYRLEKWIIDFYYNFGYFEVRKVNNEILSGEYENFTHAIGLSVGYKF